MYDSYDYSENRETMDAPLTQAELKARRIAQKRAFKEQKKAIRRQKRESRGGGGGAGKFFATVGLGLAFGVVACLAFQGVDYIFDEYIRPDTSIVYQSVNSSYAGADNVIDKKELEQQIDEKIKDEISDFLDDISVEAADNKVTVSTKSSYYGSVVDVVEKAMPSIVAITNKSIQEIPSFYGMGWQKYEVEGGGSGIIIGQNDTELLIATNAHVISSAKTLTVMFVDGEACEAQIKGSDEINDIAIIAVNLSDIKGSTLDKITPCKLGDSDKLKLGEQVVAIGNALGYGQSVTAGIVSALDRQIANEGAGYIQTDAAINPGNSGGALLNMKGELIGINTAKLANTKIEGMGYAIPISSAEPIIDDLMSLTTRKKVDEKDAGYLGIQGLSVSQEISSQYNIPIGVYVSEVEKGKAADIAGIQNGDVIVKVDGIGMDSMNKLKERLLYYKAGEDIEVVVKRVVEGEYKEVTMKVTLDSRAGTALDPNNKSDEPDDTDDEYTEDEYIIEDDDSGQRNGEFNFGNSTFRYSIPEDIFKFFGR